MKTIIIDGVEYNLTPKIMFKNGTWLVENESNNYARFIQILEVVDVQGKERYRISRDLHNDEDVVECRFIENNYHSFNIQDAKDGDVLASELCDTIMIYKGIEDNNIQFYCDYDFSDIDVSGDRFSINKGQHYGSINDSDDWHPATKEQRDTLIKAMADARYTFDFNKKELWKIEQNSVDMVEHNIPHLTDFENAVKNMINDYRDAIGDNDATIKEIKELAAYLLSLIHQRSAWSEEDETKIKSIIALLKSPAICAMDGNKGIIDESIKYLKSLKDRVQPKQEWSEQEQVRINRIVSCLENLNVADNDILLKDVDWLKSIRPQNTWKPSEGQLECLGYAIDKAEKDWSPLTNNRIYLTLKALKEQLLELIGSKV